MMPIGEDNSSEKSVPIVTYSLIALNFLFFLLELGSGENFITDWAFIPNRFRMNPVSNISTIFTSMFMHGGWLHLGGNMLYLWIFGDNVEDRLGKIKYLLFYLFCGIVATFAQYAFNPSSEIPNIGASGAIAGVLGAYIFFFPKNSIEVLIGNTIAHLPALIVIGFWFFIQFISSMGSLAATQESGGVAYLAHVGGFVAGLIIAMIFSAFQNKI